MKRSISLILALFMLFTFVMPVSALEGYDKELENVIKKAKTLFNITSDYDKFEYQINSYSGTVEYYLRWYDSTEKAGDLQVTIDSDGMVRDYYKYNYNLERGNDTLPKVSKEEGLEKANNFLKKVVPEVVDKVMYIESNEPLNVYDRTYYYNYYRIENGVPFYQNRIYVNVDNMTGEVQSFNCYWDKNIKFDSKDGIIGLEDAKKAYAEKIGLKLVYKLERRNRELTPYIVYTSLNNDKEIDAKTGEPTSFNYYIGYGNDDVADKEMAADNVAGSVSLSPEELEAVSKAKDIISKEEAEKVARQILQIDDEYKLNNINLYSQWYNKDDFMWSMSFSHKEENHINISVDAKNKDIKSFYKYVPYSEKAVAKYDREELQKKAEEFIKKVQKDKFNSVELIDINEPIVRPLSEEMPRQQYFTFIRKVGNAYFQGNGFDLNMDAVTGEITNYNYNWYKGQLPSTDKAINLDKAYDILYNKIGMELQYAKDYVIYDEQEKEENNAKLIYAIKKDKPLNIDAFTGELLYGLNRPYKDNTVSQYSDIEDSYAKMQIETLAKYGVSFSGDKFNPKANIKQKEFLYLILKAKNSYYDVSDEDKDFIEKLYKYLINEKIIQENEKSPESTITKEEAAKYVVRALGYEKVANLKDIYKLSFKDADKISSELIGYVAIASGLGVVEGDNDIFNPKTNMTKEQAAVVVYNLLSIK
ncbi:S-layer homology domain-containing protein [Proteiniborus sp. MB09-C3]|uniref:S-layer homology domain-containing protein n=1 Tax=Proteiniborus sp. MB09-C3 TaxID=3050072 RepID=UPI002553D74C|nr:S-layer homology domain-containing protein [Proteiniborus sp. MB09-C3]WIV11829.1 S-layer homology domain-containing protein [Proteiniborus sp. MB09-C3]